MENWNEAQGTTKIVIIFTGITTPCTIIRFKDQFVFQNDQAMYDPIYDDNEMEVDQTYNTEQDGELGKWH